MCMRNAEMRVLYASSPTHALTMGLSWSDIDTEMHVNLSIGTGVQVPLRAMNKNAHVIHACG